MLRSTKALVDNVMDLDLSMGYPKNYLMKAFERLYQYILPNETVYFSLVGVVEGSKYVPMIITSERIILFEVQDAKSVAGYVFSLDRFDIKRVVRRVKNKQSEIGIQMLDVKMPAPNDGSIYNFTIKSRDLYSVHELIIRSFNISGQYEQLMSIRELSATTQEIMDIKKNMKSLLT